MFRKWQQLTLVHAMCKFTLKQEKLDLEDWIGKVFKLSLVHAMCKFRLKEEKLDLEDWIGKVFTFAASVSV